jgi:hypothetical protein
MHNEYGRLEYGGLRTIVGVDGRAIMKCIVALAFGDLRRLAPIRPVRLYHRDFAAISMLPRAWYVLAVDPSRP